MSFSLDKVVPWGRSFEEYAAFFALSEDDLNGKILGCGDGPAGFNAEVNRRGGHAISVDPLYKFTPNEIRARIDETFHVVINETGKNLTQFTWRHIPSLEALGEIRMLTMQEFLADFLTGAGRYVAGALPDLPISKEKFTLALCSHFLFLYSEQLSEEFHL